MSIHLMHRVTQLNLPPMETLVLLLLADNANDDGLAWPSIDLVAWKANLPPRSVKRFLHALRDRGVIEPEGTMQGGRGLTTRYRLHLERAPAKPPFIARKGDTPSPFDAQNSDTPSPFNGKGDTPSPFNLPRVYVKGDTPSPFQALKGDTDGLKGDTPSPKPPRTKINDENVPINTNNRAAHDVSAPALARAREDDPADDERDAAVAALRAELDAHRANYAVVPAIRITDEQRALLRSLPLWRQQLARLEERERQEAR